MILNITKLVKGKHEPQSHSLFPPLSLSLCVCMCVDICLRMCVRANIATPIFHFLYNNSTHFIRKRSFHKTLTQSTLLRPKKYNYLFAIFTANNLDTDLMTYISIRYILPSHPKSRDNGPEKIPSKFNFKPTATQYFLLVLVERTFYLSWPINQRVNVLIL